jgi:hypothetical protein
LSRQRAGNSTFVSGGQEAIAEQTRAPGLVDGQMAVEYRTITLGKQLNAIPMVESSPFPAA